MKFIKTTGLIIAVMIITAYGNLQSQTEGEKVGEVKQVDQSAGVVVVGSPTAGSDIKMGDLLYMRIDSKVVLVRATFPMQTVAKCKPEGKNRDIWTKAEKGMPVYRYNKDILLEVSSDDAGGNSLLLETIGASGGSNLYLTYLSIGVIADAHTKEVYDKSQTITFVNSITGYAKIQYDYMGKLIKSKDISQAEAELLKKMMDCYSLLMEEGKFLVDYVNTGKDASLTAYDSKRQQAWALISELLGFNK